MSGRKQTPGRERASGGLQPNEISEAFTLLSEPWIYVVDGAGKLLAHGTGSLLLLPR